jgi:hypothetical protein
LYDEVLLGACLGLHPQMFYVCISGLSRRVVDSEYAGADFKGKCTVSAASVQGVLMDRVKYDLIQHSLIFIEISHHNALE